MYVCVQECVHRYVCEMCVHMCECVYVCMYAYMCVLANDIVTYPGCHSSLKWERKELHAFLYVGEAHAVHTRHTVTLCILQNSSGLSSQVVYIYIHSIHHRIMNYILHIFIQ